MTDTAPIPKGFIVFTGAYEIYYDYDSAETRLEELLDAGHNWPTVIKVDLTEKDGTEPLGMSAHKVINISSAREIR